jgi:hypothetical protein
MKYIAMGRRAWLFLGSDKAGANHAIVLSILSTCRRHGVEPWAYLTDVIERLTNGNYKSLEELLPHLWKQANSEQKLAEIKPNWGTQKSFKQDRDPQNRCETVDLRAAI